MLLKKLMALVVLLAAPYAQAAYVTLNQAGMSSIFSQASFGNTTVDIRYGAVTQLVRPDLLTITTDTQVSTLFGLHSGAANVVNFYFVDTLDSCGGFNVNYIGCGEYPGNDFVVESVWAADNTPQAGGFTFGEQLLAHELGHNLGLGHRNGDFLMNPFINGFGALNASEVAQILASPLIQFDGSGQRYVQINPILVVASESRNVPEPSTILLMLAAFGAVGIQAGKRNKRMH